MNLVFDKSQIFIYRPTIIVEENPLLSDSQHQMQEQTEPPIKFVSQSPPPQTQSGGIRVCTQKFTPVLTDHREQSQNRSLDHNSADSAVKQIHVAG